jgi:ribonucleoside-diphosphate reductase beta chain
MQKELLLQDNPERFVILPIKYDKIWHAYLEHKGALWDVNEVDLSQDPHDWNDKLDADERYFLSHILAFFAASDGIVLENLVVNFMKEIQIPEARSFYGFQTFMENIHSEMYSRLIDTLIKNPEEKYRLLHAIDTIPVVRKKADWAVKWIGNLNKTYFDDLPTCVKTALTSNKKLTKETKVWMSEQKRPFAERLIAFAAVEGIFFSGSFCSIFWLKERDDLDGSIMPGLIQSNELIARDEGMHQEFACLLYTMISNKLPQERVHQIIEEAVEIEKEFITEAIPCNLINMNSQLMKTYIEFVANRLVKSLGYEPIYKNSDGEYVECPFKFMDNLGQDNKGNFFEKKITEYQKANVLGKNKTIRFDVTKF